MATDYDAPRINSTEHSASAPPVLSGSRQDRAHSGLIEVDEPDVTDGLDLPGADLSALTVDDFATEVETRRSDEFVCSRCFLLQHHTRLNGHRTGQPVCRDCA